MCTQDLWEGCKKDEVCTSGHLCSINPKVSTEWIFYHSYFHHKNGAKNNRHFKEVGKVLKKVFISSSDF